MSVIGSNILAGASGQAVGYQVERSLRFNSSDSGYCSRTFTSAGNRKTWTWAAWVKRSAVGSGDQMLFSTGSSGATTSAVIFFRDDTFAYASLAANVLVTSALFRDPSAWYHFVVLFDSTQATASNRLRFFVNGSEITQFSTDARAAQISQSTDYGFNLNQTHELGRFTADSSRYFSGYLADIHFIDGQALTPSSFTEVSATTGQLIPKAYTGTFGTNGFWLKFSDNSNNTATTLGKDYSPNGNNWTPNNLSVTAGAGNDSLVDTPTSYGTDTGAGGEVRGNYATLNPLTAASGFTLSNGNLEISSPSASVPVVLGTIAVNSGKWYWEVTLSSSDAYAGAATITSRSAVAYLGAAAGQFIYNTAQPSSSWLNGNIYNYSTASVCVAGDVIGVALNFDTNTITFYKNGVSQGAFSSNVLGTDTWAPAFKSNTAGASETFNFGQRPFAYAAPSGFKALCDTNLPAPVVAKPSSVFDVKLYTGNGSSQTITGLGFSPDFVWLKSRTNANWHELNDTVRTAGKILYSNATDAEVTAGRFTAFTSDGFSVSTTGGDGTNFLNAAMVGWCWDAGTSTVTNTQGSITSSVRANASAGFSIVTLTTNSGGGGSYGHGLNVAPAMVIQKSRTNAQVWGVYHQSLGAGKYIELNSTGSAVTTNDVWSGTAPSSTVVNLGSGWTNANHGNVVAYCFAPVAGYASMGSWSGSGNADGPFIYTGFRPKLVIWKNITSAENWVMMDTSRDPSNVASNYLFPNSSAAEGTTAIFDILSNGFKMRNTFLSSNSASNTYIYCAWAENPFQYARAR